MALGSDDGKTTRLANLRRKLDVRTTAGHVGGDGNRAGLTCLSDNLSLTGMLFRVKNLRLDAPAEEHPAEEFRRVHICRSDKHRTSLLPKFDNFLYYSIVLSLFCLVDQVVVVNSRNRSIRRDDNHVKFVDAPELSCLSLRRTGHSGKLVIHTEIVLEGDGRECLCRSLNLHVFLRLHCLMESVAPTATLHNTTCLFVDNLDFSVFGYDVVDIELEHRVCLEKLDDSVHTLALEGEVCHKFILLLPLLCRVCHRLLNLGNCRTDVRKDEEVIVIDRLSKQVASLVRHVHGVLLLVDDKVERIRDVRHFLLVVLDVVVFNLLEKLLHARLTEELDERTIFRIALVGTEQENSALLLVALGYEFLRIVENASNQSLLLIVEVLHKRLILRELLVVSSLYRT